MAEDAKVTRIEIRYADGSVRYAEGDDAAAVVRHWNSCEVFQHLSLGAGAGNGDTDGNGDADTEGESDSTNQSDVRPLRQGVRLC